MITDYDIVKAIEVSDKLREGWQPYGEPFVNGSGLVQAIVKRSTGLPVVFKSSYIPPQVFEE